MMKKPEIPKMNKSEAAQLEQEKAENCPTCGGPMKAAPIPESELSSEHGGSHSLKAILTGTDYPGYRERKLKPMQKVSGG